MPLDKTKRMKRHPDEVSVYSAQVDRAARPRNPGAARSKWDDFQYRTQPSPADGLFGVAAGIGRFAWNALCGALIMAIALAVSLPAIISGVLGLLPLIIIFYLIAPH